MPRTAVLALRKIPKFGRLASRLPVRGLPPGLDAGVLTQALGPSPDRPTPTSFTHISGWKTTGAFRIYMRTGAGAQRTLIFKNEVYGTADNPALAGLPIRPGPPEFSVYHIAEQLQEWLPPVLWCEEVEPGTHYRYLLGDLAPDHRYPSGDQDHEDIAAELARLHRALREVRFADDARLLDYLAVPADQFLDYFHRSLTAYRKTAHGAAVEPLLDAWDRIARLYDSDEFRSPAHAAVIHGDPNFTNVHFSRSEPGRIRFVDWEWCGRHLPHADLAALLKTASAEGETAAVRRYAEVAGDGTFEEHLRRFRWCRLERGLIDASFMAILKLESAAAPTRFDIGAMVDHSAGRAMEAARLLW